jgi:phage-related baseplate assembly protein
MNLSPRNKKLLLVATALSILIPVAVAYVVLNLSAQVTVQEPLSVGGVSIVDSSSNSLGSCSSSSPGSFTCSISVYAGESGAIYFTISNAASVAIVPTVQATSSDPTNVPVSVSSIPHNGIPAGGSLGVTVSFTVSQSTPPESVTISVTVSR